MHLISFVDDIRPEIVTPALDPQFRISQVTLFCEDEKRRDATHVAEEIRHAKLPVNTLPIRPEWDVQAVHERLSSVISLSPAPCLINLSAATPLQAAIAQQVALRHNVASFVIHPEEDRLLWLTPPPSAQPAEDASIADTLDLERYFGLYGIELVECKYRLGNRDSKLEKLSCELMDIAIRQPEAIHTLNRLGAGMDKNFVSRLHIPVEQKELKDFISRCAIACRTSDDRIDFGDAETRFFLCGGWLEVWLLYQVAQLRDEFDIHDAASGVKIVSNETVRNEYDLAMLVNNQLFLVECKTVVQKGQGGGVGMDVLFKLDSVSQLGGLHAHAMLISLSVATADEVSRATLQGLALINGKELHNIRERLRHWIRATT
ncbi:protein of unknown function [Propionivibrio dicarboxylicus]|uniref:Card1 endonuclease domain-containing protein n=1 Tax=Propionivibrio dicarboxylicus TaxID=83767 RepID=A0A1G8N4W1_9RHOO|nr:DUF1887 family CARF protein [Propionivibrio dicarboxylicus]SDI75155.1 protein of unknown function [Propionivibrio dicarboxylicus]